MSKQSAGILLYRLKNKVLYVLLVHPGGPFWAKKDIGTWSIPKGELEESENAFDAAKREASEETGIKLEYFDPSLFHELKPVKIKSGKTIFTWAVEGDFDISKLTSNFFEMEWPPKSGIKEQFPEIHKAGWFTIEEARIKINTGQVPILEEIVEMLKH
ncbi:MAG TPA: NUDIX domain-containing protein [Hanamia sp.]